MTIPINKVSPQFGVGFGAAWIGFTRGRSPLDEAIAYGERGEGPATLPVVTHTFVVEGPLTGIEAAEPGGVARFELAKYLAEPTVEVFFRQPVHLSGSSGREILDFAHSAIGARYDLGLMAAEAGAKTLFGRWINALFHNGPQKAINRWVCGSREYICSELVAACLGRVPEYKNLGVLAREPLNCIDPQQLFSDPVLFDPFINDCSFAPDDNAAARTPAIDAPEPPHPNASQECVITPGLPGPINRAADAAAGQENLGCVQAAPATLPPAPAPICPACQSTNCAGCPHT